MIRHEEQMKRSAAKMSIASNTALMIFKLVVGFYVGAVSIISEAIHSAVDLIAAMIAYYAVRTSSKPPDGDHAYGHGKLENLSGAIEALLIVGAAIWIIIEAAEKLGTNMMPEYLSYGIYVMGISIVVNLFVSERLLRVARKTESQALEADALHLRADVWTSVGVLVGLVLMEITGLTWIDPMMAILVAMIIFRAGYRMTLKSAGDLTDRTLPPSEEAVIVNILDSHEAVLEYHCLRTRKSGQYRFVDVHIVMDKNMSLERAHNISDQIEQLIKAKLSACSVVIHMEPTGEEKTPIKQ